MGVIYLISLLILLTSFLLKKKTEKELDIVGFITISIVLLLCYNIFICYVLTFFTVPCNLWILAIINLVLSLAFFINIIKKKEIQKYVFNKIDILYISIIIVVLLAVLYMNFGFQPHIKYETGDSAIHYLVAYRFAKNDSLLPGIQEYDAVFGPLSSFRPGAYINTGLAMKCFAKNMDTLGCYSVFVGFEAFVFVLIGINIYTALKKFAKKKEHGFWACIISLICTLGYPLNSLLFGFEYLTMSLLIVCSIIDCIYYYENSEISCKYIMLVLALLNLTLFLSYYMFVPVIYSSLWIYFCIRNYKTTKKIITKDLVILLIVILIIPFILGYAYCFAEDLYSIIIRVRDTLRESAITMTANEIAEEQSINTFQDLNWNKETKIDKLKNLLLGISQGILRGFNMNGYTYINLYSNMLLLIPSVIYLVVKSIKAGGLKENGFVLLTVFWALVFIGVLFLGYKFKKVSIYYLLKNYYLLWIILTFINYKALVDISDKGNYLPRLFIGVYVFLIIICVKFSDVKVTNSLTNPDEKVTSVMEVFCANKTIIQNKPVKCNEKELEILKYAKQNLDFNKEIEIVTDHTAYVWAYVLLEHETNISKKSDGFGGQFELTKKWKNLRKRIKTADYVIYLNGTEYYQILKEYLFDDAEVVYENEAGGVLKYNREGD